MRDARFARRVRKSVGQERNCAPLGTTHQRNGANPLARSFKSSPRGSLSAVRVPQWSPSLLDWPCQTCVVRVFQIFQNRGCGCGCGCGCGPNRSQLNLGGYMTCAEPKCLTGYVHRGFILNQDMIPPVSISPANWSGRQSNHAAAPFHQISWYLRRASLWSWPSVSSTKAKLPGAYSKVTCAHFDQSEWCHSHPMAFIPSPSFLL
jgi:hypothetical protein